MIRNECHWYLQTAHDIVSYIVTDIVTDILHKTLDIECRIDLDIGYDILNKNYDIEVAFFRYRSVGTSISVTFDIDHQYRYLDLRYRIASILKFISTLISKFWPSISKVYSISKTSISKLHFNTDVLSFNIKGPPGPTADSQIKLDLFYIGCNRAVWGSISIIIAPYGVVFQLL